MRTPHRHGIRLLAASLLLGLLACALAGDLSAQGAKTSESVVKITGKADRPDAGGKQTVTLTVAIQSPWHLYANPVGSDDLASAQTTVLPASAGPCQSTLEREIAARTVAPTIT